jgi:hypothetical protein
MCCQVLDDHSNHMCFQVLDDLRLLEEPAGALLGPQVW